MKEWVVPILVVGGLVAVGFVIRTWVLKKASGGEAGADGGAVPCAPQEMPGNMKITPPAEKGDRVGQELGAEWVPKYHPFLGYPEEVAPPAEIKITEPKDNAEFPLDEMVIVPAGEFTMGDEKLPFASPARKVFVEGFRIDRYEVTHAQYKKFIDATGHPAPDLIDDWARDVAWRERTYPKRRANRPVVLVSFEDARAFCQWAGKRLPTEAEWEKAARGPAGNAYPWGNAWDGRNSNTLERTAGPLKTQADYDAFARQIPTPPPEGWLTFAAGSYGKDKSPYGVMDMHGNVAEWVDEPFKPPEGGDPRGSPLYQEPNIVVLKGVGALDRDYAAPVAARFPYFIEYMDVDVGFRCAADQ